MVEIILEITFKMNLEQLLNSFVYVTLFLNHVFHTYKLFYCMKYANIVVESYFKVVIYNYKLKMCLMQTPTKCKYGFYGLNFKASLN